MYLERKHVLLGAEEKDRIASVSLFQDCKQTQSRIVCASFASF